jgi:hypothetical protein
MLGALTINGRIIEYTFVVPDPYQVRGRPDPASRNFTLVPGLRREDD